MVKIIDTPSFSMVNSWKSQSVSTRGNLSPPPPPHDKHLFNSATVSSRDSSWPSGSRSCVATQGELSPTKEESPPIWTCFHRFFARVAEHDLRARLHKLAIRQNSWVCGSAVKSFYSAYKRAYILPLCPGLNASLVWLVLHIWQGFFDIFTLLHIWQNCVCFVDFLHAVRTLCDAYHKEFECN